jgi:hypothetical protein
MRQPDRKPRVRDTVFMSGWLFADLLLALAVLFLAANTIGIKIPPPPPPKLAITPTRLDPTSPNCKGGVTQPQCTVTLTETADSRGNLNWTAQSDISSGLVFIPPGGILSPGKSVNIQISHLACENNSLTFSGSGGAIPVTILWRCTPPANDRILEHEYCRIRLNIAAPGVFINDNINTARSIVEPQLDLVKFLKGRQVGIAIAYGGTIGGTEGQGTDVATQVYNVLKVLAKDNRAPLYPVFKTASWYEPLFTGFESSNTGIINVYLVVRANNPKETCNAQHNPI